MYTHAYLVGTITEVSALGIVLTRTRVPGHSRLSQTTLDTCARCTQSGGTKMLPRVIQKSIWCVSSLEEASRKPHTYVSTWPLSSHLPLPSSQASRLLWAGRELTAGSQWIGDSWLHPFPSQGGSASWSPGRIRCLTPHRWQCWGAEVSAPLLQCIQLRRKVLERNISK